MLTATKVPLSPFAVGVGIFVNFVIFRLFTVGGRLLRWRNVRGSYWCSQDLRCGTNATPLAFGQGIAQLVTCPLGDGEKSFDNVGLSRGDVG